MRRVAWLMMGIMAVVPVVKAVENPVDGSKITGVREWLFTDGTKQRASIHRYKGRIWVGGDGRASWNKTVDRNIPDQKAILEAVESEKIEIVNPLVPTSIITPKGEPPADGVTTLPRLIGKEREWKRADGKTARGALVNVADD